MDEQYPRDRGTQQVLCRPIRLWRSGRGDSRGLSTVFGLGPLSQCLTTIRIAAKAIGIVAPVHRAIRPRDTRRDGKERTILGERVTAANERPLNPRAINQTQRRSTER